MLPAERIFHVHKPVRRVFEALEFHGVLIHVQSVCADGWGAILCEPRHNADKLLERFPSGVTRAK